jgi:hypothetical protein
MQAHRRQCAVTAARARLWVEGSCAWLLRLDGIGAGNQTWGGAGRRKEGAQCAKGVRMCAVLPRTCLPYAHSTCARSARLFKALGLSARKLKFLRQAFTEDVDRK